jgi:uncharacterized membrane protein YhaH (DUF805 family)
MSTPNGHQEPYEPNPHEPGQQPPQTPGGQDTRAPEEDIPRQQAPREDQYAAPGQGQQVPGQGQQVPGQGQQVPGQGAGGMGGQQGTYNAYPAGGGYYPGGARPLSYLDGAPVGFGDAVSGAVRNIFTYWGRASRSAFWWFALLEVIAYLVVSWISYDSRVAGVILDILVGLPLILVGIALAVRRLHDSGRTGWWWWIGFIPVVGGIVLLVFYLLPGTPRPNRYNVTR